MARLPKGLFPLAKSKDPKRSRSSYFLWCDAIRSSKDAEIHGKSMAVASKVLAARWKTLSKEDKAPFQKQAQELKDEFLKTHTATTTETRLVLPSGWKAVRDLVSNDMCYTCLLTGRSQWTRPTEEDGVPMPPQPPSARRMFENTLISSDKRLSPREVTALWKALSPDDLARYDKMASAARTDFKKLLKKSRAPASTPAPSQPAQADA